MKKTLSFILALVMVAAMFAVIAMPASADAAAATPIASDVWDGNVDTTWFNIDTYETTEEYVLTTAEQLAGLAQLVNTNVTDEAAGITKWADKPFDGKTIKLGADIILNEGIVGLDENDIPTYNGASAMTVDMSSGTPEVVLDTTKVKAWPVIGTGHEALDNNNGLNSVDNCKSTYFYGNFDGQDHVISGLLAYAPTASCTGLFSVFAGESFKNVSLVNSLIYGMKRSGSLMGWVSNYDKYDVTVEDVYSNAIVYNKDCGGNARSGGIFGMARCVKSLTVKNVWFDGHLIGRSAETSYTPYMGGIAGFIVSDIATSQGEAITFDSCLVTGSIDGYITGVSEANLPKRGIGGILGSYHTGDASADLTPEFLPTELTIKNCLVAVESTNLTDTSSMLTLGAIMPRFEKNVSNYTLQNCYFIPNGIFNTAKATITNASTTKRVVKVNGVEFATANTYSDELAGASITKFSEATGLSADTFALTDTTAAIKGLRTCLAECVYGTLIAEEAASCDGDGVKAHYECGICGKLYDEQKVEKTAADLVIPASHNYGEWVPAVEATLNNAGVLGHYECADCHKYFDADKNEIASIEGEAQLTTPVATTTKAPTTDAKPEADTTTAAPADAGKKSCGGFTALGAVLALVAVTGAAIVIKKK